MSRKPTYDELKQRVEELERKYSGPHEVKGQVKPEMNGQTEGTLENERRQLLSIFDSIDQPVYVSDPDTYEILYVNEVLKASLGDVVGRKCYKVFQNMTSPCPFCTNDRIFGENSGRQYIWEFKNRTTGRWFHCIDKAIAWPDGRMVRYEMAIDITEGKAAEEVLSRFFEISPDMICIADLEGTFRFVNPAFEKGLGYSREELTSTPYINFVHRDDRASTLATSKRVREGVCPSCNSRIAIDAMTGPTGGFPGSPCRFPKQASPMPLHAM